MPLSFGQMQQDLQLVGMANLLNSDLGALLNRVQSEEMDQQIWSFSLTNIVMYTLAPYTTGKVTCVPGSPIVTGTGTAWTSALNGFQLRFGPSGMTLFVNEVTSPTTLTLEQIYAGVPVNNVSYSLQQSFYPILNASEVTNIRNTVDLEKTSREVINLTDPQRLSVGGNPCLAWAPAPYITIPTTFAIASIGVGFNHVAGVNLALPTYAISVGDSITIAGNSSPQFNGTWTVSAIGSPTNIQFISDVNTIPIGTGGTLIDANIPANSTLQVEMWPVPSAPVPYVVEYRAIATPMVNLTDMPQVPSAVLEAKAMMYAAQASYASNGAPQWKDLADTYQKQYLKERDDALYADGKRIKTLHMHSPARSFNGLDYLPSHDPL